MVLVQYPSADNALALLHHPNAPLCQVFLLLPQFYPTILCGRLNTKQNVFFFCEKILYIEDDLSWQWQNIVPELGFLRTFAQKLAPKSL